MEETHFWGQVSPMKGFWVRTTMNGTSLGSHFVEQISHSSSGERTIDIEIDRAHTVRLRGY